MPAQPSTEPFVFPFAAAYELGYAPELVALRGTPPRPMIMPDGSPAWLVAAYEDVRSALVDPRLSRKAASAPGVTQTAAAAGLSLLGVDAPEHTRLRRLVATAFTQRRVEELRPGIERIVAGLVDGLCDRPQPVDLVEHFCRPLPIGVICELLGVPLADREDFVGWSAEVMSSMDEVGAAIAARAYANLDGYIRDLIADKRERPDGGLISGLIVARDQDDRLSEDEMVSLSVLLLIAGNETTGSQFTTALTLLLTDPGSRARVGGEDMPGLVDELLRVQSISAIGGALPRVAIADVEIGGVTIPAGSVVLPASALANMDPAAYPEPETVDPSRPHKPHLAFGTGIHHCLGAQLARAELSVGITGLFAAFPELRLAVDPGELALTRGSVMRYLTALPVRW